MTSRSRVAARYAFSACACAAEPTTVKPSEASAARFLALRAQRRAESGRFLRARRRRAVTPDPAPAANPNARISPRRITVDFAEPTLRAIGAALAYRMEHEMLLGDDLILTQMAINMVAIALGDSVRARVVMTDRGVPP